MTTPAVPIGGDPLAGTLVRLRELRDEDIPTLCAWWSDPVVSTYQRAVAQHAPRAESLADMFRGWSDDTATGFAQCVTLLDDGDLVGHLGIHSATVKDRCGTLGIMMGPAYQDRGYGTDALRVAIRYAFTELGLHRIGLEAFGYNERAIAVYRKLGFVEEGRRRESLYRAGEWHDEVLMGLLRAEWWQAATG